MLRALMREMYQVNPRCQGVWAAIPAPVQLGDTEIIPDLEAILASPRVDWPYWLGYEENLRKYLAKLKYQHDRKELLRIVETQRDWSSVLRWAVWRALWLKVDRETIHDALSKNQRGTTVGPRKGHDITEGILYVVFGEGPDYTIDPKHGKVPRFPPSGILDLQFDTLIFDRDEFRQYLRDSHAAGKASRKRREEEQAEAHRIQREAKTWTEEQRAEYMKGKRKEGAERASKGWLNLDERIRKYTLRAIFEAAPAAKQSSSRVGSTEDHKD